WRALASLGLAAVQQARLTADPSWYPRAEQALRRSLALAPNGNVDALLGMGALALARHDFATALQWGRRAHRANPDGAAPLGVVGDALVELGRYREAFRAFQRMVDLRPDLASYARASYALELQGDVPRALRAMRLAFGAAGTPADAAWAAHQVGELHWSVGQLELAGRWYRRALQLDPSFVPARAGLARVAWARGHAARARRLLRSAVEVYPLPEYVVALGDLYLASGDRARAEEQYALARAEQRLFRANGVNVDLELALFQADHGMDVEAALARARAEYLRRPSVQAADVLAWTLYANGRYEEAWRFAREALRLGTKNALFHFHAGMIALRLGDREEARRHLSAALSLNPWFSFLHAAEARRALERLEAQG
ncbi:MAG TPA: tetratricopeptide repeat protein, partial [Actinomycetota bacterium]|nr:tetratricopeptide repeat protein [Actinomycetota bacterium]